MNQEWKRARRKSLNNRELLIAISDNNFEEITRLINEGADINFKHQDGYTALHLAVTCGNSKVVKLLMTRGADLTINDVNHETALDIAKRTKQSGIVNILQAISEQNLQVPEIDVSKISMTSQGNVPPEISETNQSGKRISWINPVHGHIFQLKVLMLFLHRGVDCKYSFKLGAEIKEAGKFDDLVFEYAQGNTKVFRLLQAKHKLDETKKITVEKLLSETKGDYSLIKYFYSYRDCKRDEYFKNGVIKDVTICTNIDFDFNNLKKFNIKVEKINDKDDILDVKSESKQSVRYKLNNSILPILRKKLQTTKLNSGRKVRDIEIEDFLQHLVFAVNQPNEEELGLIVKKEIGKDLDFITTENLYNKFFVKMFDLMKDKGRFVSYNEGKNLFDEVKKGSYFWYDIQDPVQSFTGRRDNLENIHKLLQANPMICVCGLGGVGKSELVKKYVAEYSQSYDNKIIWINAESYKTLVDSFRKLACGKLDISTTNADGKDKPMSTIVAEVYRYFSKSKSLFIFDNSEMYHSHDDFDAGIDRFLPTLPSNCIKPNIIITSRHQKWPENIKILALDGFTEDEAETFVSNYLHLKSNEQKEYVRKLGITLQLLPLALQQAVAFIKAQNIEFSKLGKKFQISDYFHSFSVKTKEFLSFELPIDCDQKYSKTVLSSWNITFDVLRRKKDGYYALKLLNILAYLLPDDISIELLCGIITNKEQLICAIDLLKQYSLINVHYRVLSIHRLVQQVTRLKLVENNKEKDVIIEILEIIFETAKPIVNSKNVDHFLSVWTYAKRYPTIVEGFNRNLIEMINVLMNSGRNEEAYSLSMENTKILEKIPLNVYDARVLRPTARICNAKALYGHGKLKEALEEYKQIYESFDGSEWYVILLEVKMHIAKTLKELRQHSEAIKWFRGLLNDCQFFLDASDFRTLATKNHIADILATEGQSDEALSIKQEIHETMEAKFGRHHGRTIEAKIDIADLLKQFGKIEEAMKLYEEIYNNQINSLENEHSITLDTKILLATLSLKLGKLEEAMKWYEEIHDYQISIFTENHPKILATKNAIANILLKQGNLNDALDRYRELYKIASKKFDDQHRININLLRNITIVLVFQKKYDTALKTLKDVLKKERNLYGFYHHSVEKTLKYKASIFEKQGESIRALKTFKKLLQCQISLYGKTSIKTLETREKIIEILRVQKRPYSALEQYLEWYEIEKYSSDIDLRIILITKHNIGMAYVENKDYEKALIILTEVYEILESNFGKEDPTCIQIHKNISSILAEQENKMFGTSIQKFIDPILTIHNNNLAELKKLLKEGADINSSDKNKYTLLHHAVDSNLPKMVQFLLKNGADVASVTEKGNTSLHIATSEGYLEVVKELSNVHPDQFKKILNAKKIKSGNTAMHIAAKNGFSGISTHLLSRGAMFNLKNNSGQSPLDLAWSQEVKEVLKKVDILFEYAKSGNDELYYELRECSDEEYLTMINARNNQGYNLLQVIVSNNHEQLVNSLQELRSARFRSVYTDKTNLIDITVNNDVLPDTKHTLKRARGLVKASKVNGNNSFNPNICAIEDMLELLTTNEKSKFIKLAERVIEFHVILLRRAINSVKLLEAAKRNDFSTVEELISKGTDVNGKDSGGWTSLHYAVNSSNERMVKKLLGKGAKAHSTTNMGITPLHIAAHKGSAEIVKDLLTSNWTGKFINAQTTAKGSTALHIAVKNRQLDIVEILLECNANCLIWNNDGQTPDDLTEEERIKALFERPIELFSQHFRNLKRATRPKDNLWFFINCKCLGFIIVIVAYFVSLFIVISHHAVEKKEQK